VYVIRRFPRFLRGVVGALLGLVAAVVSLNASALAGGKSEFQAFMDLTTGGNHTVTFGSNGTPLITTPAGTGARAGNMMFSAGKASGSFAFDSPVGGKAFATGTQAFKAAAAGRALFNLAKAFSTPLLVGMALYDLAKDLGFTPQWSDSAQANLFYKPVLYCDQVSCYFTAGGDPYKAASRQAACDHYVAVNKPSGYTGRIDPSNNFCYMTGPAGQDGGGVGTFAVGQPVQTLQYADPDAMQAFDDYLGSPTWPVNPHLDQAIADGINSGQLTLDTDGDPVVVPDPSRSLVQSSPATTTGTDGSSISTVQKCELVQRSLGGSSTVGWDCWSETTTTTPDKHTTTTTTKADGTTETSTTTTPGGTTTTTTNPQPYQDPCAKEADTVGCTKLGTPAPDANDTLKKDTKTITFTPVSFQGGACPGPVPFSVFGKSYAFSYDLLCSKLQLISVILLVLSGAMAAYIFADGFRV
jgi:hypothetical protein